MAENDFYIKLEALVETEIRRRTKLFRERVTASLIKAGFTETEIAGVFDVSHQRINQIKKNIESRDAREARVAKQVQEALSQNLDPMYGDRPSKEVSIRELNFPMRIYLRLYGHGITTIDKLDRASLTDLQSAGLSVTADVVLVRNKYKELGRTGVFSARAYKIK